MSESKKKHNIKLLCIGVFLGLVISLMFFLIVLFPTMKRLENQKREYIENKFTIDVESVYELYYSQIISLDPNDKWYKYDVHTLKLKLHIWIQENKSILSEEQKEDFSNLYQQYCDLEQQINS